MVCRHRFDETQLQIAIEHWTGLYELDVVNGFKQRRCTQRVRVGRRLERWLLDPP
jgi:hypothetical protein